MSSEGRPNSSADNDESVAFGIITPLVTGYEMQGVRVITICPIDIGNPITEEETLPMKYTPEYKEVANTMNPFIEEEERGPRRNIRMENTFTYNHTQEYFQGIQGLKSMTIYTLKKK